MNNQTLQEEPEYWEQIKRENIAWDVRNDGPKGPYKFDAPDPSLYDQEEEDDDDRD